MRERVLAILAAVALVAVAVVARSALAGDGGGGKGTGGAKGRPVVACTADLATVCAALARDGKIAADPPTLDLDAADAPVGDIDGWITWAPAPAIANFDSGHDAWTATESVARGRLAVLAPRTILDGLADGCGGGVDWACIAGADSTVATVGVGSPGTAEGLARLLPLADALSDAQDPTTLDTAQARGLVAGPVGGQDSAVAMGNLLVTAGPASVSVVVVPEALGQQLAATPRGGSERLTTLVPGPHADIGVVLSTRQGSDLGGLAAALRSGRAARALRGLGLVPATGRLADDDVAGFLFQVRKKVGQ